MSAVPVKMCKDVCVDKCMVDIFMHMCLDMCVDMCVDLCVDMSADMRTHAHIVGHEDSVLAQSVPDPRLPCVFFKKTFAGHAGVRARVRAMRRSGQAVPAQTCR